MITPMDGSPVGGREGIYRRLAVLSILLSLAISATLGLLHNTLGGPGDQLSYYTQAAHIFPFRDHYYGPGYFVALRLVKDLTGLPWFESGKLLSWLSMAAFLALSYLLLTRVLPGKYGYLGVLLVALNPTIIEASYSSLTIGFGAVLVLAAIVTLVRAEEAERLPIISGLLFGLASLTRFQATGFLLGAVAGLVICPGRSLPHRFKNAATLGIGFLFPLLLWDLLLFLVQGGAPANHNFIHLTIALDRFTSHLEFRDLVKEYGSFFGVLGAPGAIKGIIKMITLEAVKFPFRAGLALFFVAAAWIVPGTILIAGVRRSWRPWVVAMAVGFLLTNVGSRGWLWYYTPLIPFFIFLILTAAEVFERYMTRGQRALQWIVVVGGLLVVAPLGIVNSFRENQWPEWEVARQFLGRTMTAGEKVSSTAMSLRYNTSLRVVSLDRLGPRADLEGLAATLRGVGVSRLVLTERHSLYEYPFLGPLLADDTSRFPVGLRRDTLITSPKRLAIFTVLP